MVFGDEILTRDPREAAMLISPIGATGGAIRITGGAISITTKLIAAIKKHALVGTLIASPMLGAIGGEVREQIAGTLGTGELRIGTAIDNLKNSRTPEDVEIFTKELDAALFASGIKEPARKRIVQRTETDRVAFQSGQQTEEQKQTAIVSENVAVQKELEKTAKEETMRPRGAFGQLTGDITKRTKEEIGRENIEEKTQFLSEAEKTPQLLTPKTTELREKFLEEEETPEQTRRRKQKASKTPKTRT